MGDNMYAKLNLKAFALTCGILWGVFLFFIAWWLIILEGFDAAPTFFVRMYPGYSISPLGSVIGLVWGFVDGLICGFIFGLIWGTHDGFNRLRLGIYLPELLPFGFPTNADFSFALMALVLPQLPMTLGNAVIANADLSQQYFDKDSRKVTYKALCFSMSLANFLSFFVGGMPLCHGAGGLAAHYQPGPSDQYPGLA